jgi:predicted phage terminase large subunit-like protein
VREDGGRDHRADRFHRPSAFNATVFRRNTTSLRAGGGAWDESQKFYPHLGAKPNGSELYWSFPSGARVKMAHLEYDSTVYDYKSAQIPLIIFDELTEFTAFQFWYMSSRNRSTCGIRPYILAGTNPDAESWVAELIAWWIDQEEFLPDGSPNPRYGLAIPERAGVLRYFTRVGDELIWGDTPAEVAANPTVREDINALVAEAAERGEPTTFDQVVSDVVQSLTFIPGKLSENRILERADPKYRGKLMAMTRVERARLLDGNWKVKASAGDYFKRHEVRLLDGVPGDVVRWVRRWDLAATEVSDKNKDPDWTCGVKMGLRADGRYVVADAIFARSRSDDVRELVLRTAGNDTPAVKVVIPQDPAQAGVDQVRSYITMLAGFTASAERETGDKETRAEPFAAQWQHGNVDVVRGAWNAQYFGQMEGFPAKGVKDDAVDASSGAFRALTPKGTDWSASSPRSGGTSRVPARR